MFSAGCHSGYNIVDADGVPASRSRSTGRRRSPSKGATLIAGTGYQYGDTDFVLYSEQIYASFAHAAAAWAAGPVSVGQALIRAKQDYLARHPDPPRHRHQGAPRVHALRPADAQRRPAARPQANPATDDSVVTATRRRDRGPGADLGLKSATSHVEATTARRAHPDS